MTRLAAVAALFALIASALTVSVSAYTDPFICLVNAERAKNGVAPLGWSQVLQDLARRQAGDMQRMGAVTHSGAWVGGLLDDLFPTSNLSLSSSSDGSTPLTRLSNIGMSAAGENVAGGQPDPSWAMCGFLLDSDFFFLPRSSLLTFFASAFSDSFMNSPGHRANILNPTYNCIGGARAGDKYAQVFGAGSDCKIPNCNRGRLARRNESKNEIADAFSVVFGEGSGSAAVEETADVYEGEA
jgi:uncharacterized protein YkwD